MIRFDNIEQALKNFRHNKPFDHCVVESFFDLKTAKGLEADFPKYEEEYRSLNHGPHHKKFPVPSYHSNLFISVGLGARGFLSAPILAKHLTSLICGEKSPLEEKICHSLHPGRFVIRALSKK